MNNKNGYIKPILLLLFAIIFPIALPIVGGIIGIYIALVHPDITYKGDRTVPEKDIIRLEKITLRDLKQDRIYSNNTCSKFYIVKNNFLSQKKLHKELSIFCCKYYDEQNEFDELTFIFYEECATMPWFWNNDGHFPDLEMNSKYRIYKCWVSKDWIKFKPDY